MPLVSQLQRSLYQRTRLVMDRKQALAYAVLEVSHGSEFQGARDLQLQALVLLLTEAELTCSYQQTIGFSARSASGKLESVQAST